MTTLIRDYRPDDWPAICRVHDRARPDELRGSFDPRAFIPLAEDPEREYIDVCEMFVALQGDEIVGFAGIDDPYFAWLYVDPAHYRQGIGRALLRHCMARLGEDAWTYACGNNAAAIALYLSEGFSIVSRFTGDNAGYKGPSVRLALNPERHGWKKPKKSESPTTTHGGPAMPVPEHALHYLEIVTPDVEAACRLYGTAYGWSFEPAAAELGDARVAALPGGGLCGIRAPMHETEEPVVRTYIRVADVEAATRAAEQLGATIALPPVELAGRGMIAIYMFGGIQQGIWQVP